MNKFFSFLYKCSCAIMIIFFGFIFYRTTTNITHMPVLEEALTGAWAPLMILSGAAALLLLFLVLQKKITRATGGKSGKILMLLMGLGIFLQLFLLFKIRPCLRYDSLNIVDAAVSMLHGSAVTGADMSGYFAIYPHNIPLCIYTMCLLKIGSIFGLSAGNYVIFLQVLNCIAIDFSVFLLYRLLLRRQNQKIATAFLLLCFFNPLMYYYPVFYYTQVLCMSFLAMLVVLFFGVSDAGTPAQKYGLAALYGVFLFFGWKVRILALIAPMACLIYLLLRGRISLTFLKNRQFWISTVALVFTFFLCLAANEKFMNRYDGLTKDDQAYPMHHWIMMGLQGEGGYNSEDDAYTRSFATEEERKEADLVVIRQRLHDLGVSGLFDLAKKKLTITWSDGYDDYADNFILSPHYTAFNDYLAGSRSELLTGYLHIYNCLVWFLLFLSAVLMFLKKTPEVPYVAALTLLGGMFFHLIWETGEAYSMPFVLLFMAGASLSLDDSWCSVSGEAETKIAFCRRFQKLSFVRRKALVVSLVIVIAANFISLSHLAPALTGTVFEATEYAAVQDLAAGELFLLEEGDVLTQTFSTSRAFNTVAIGYMNTSRDTKTEVFRLRILDEQGEILCDQKLSLEGYTYLTDISVPLITPVGEEAYALEITALTTAADKSHVCFAGYLSGNYDVYQQGSISIAGNSVKNGDLTFMIYNKVHRTML